MEKLWAYYGNYGYLRDIYDNQGGFSQSKVDLLLRGTNFQLLR